MRELLVAGAGLAGAAALIVFAFIAVPDPDVGAELVLDRVARNAAEAVIDVWEQRLRLDEPPAPTLVAPLRWREKDSPEPAPRPEPKPIVVPDPTGSAFGALVAAAEAAELHEQDLPQAAELLVDALDQAPGREAASLVRLRLLQLLTRVGRTERARQQWEQLQRDLSGDETFEGVSVLLRAGLALAPSLTEDDRSTVASVLAERWLAGHVAVPAANVELEMVNGEPSFSASPSWQLLFDRLLGISPADVHARLEERREHLRVPALREHLGELPAAPLDRWRLVPLPFRGTGPDEAPLIWLAVRHVEPAGVEAHVLRRADLLEGLRHDLRSARGLSEDIVLELDSDGGQGTRIRRPERLPGSTLAFAIRHLDPSSVRGEEERRLLLLRGGFVALGVLLALATLLAARSLARERQLQALRTAFVASASHELRTPVSSLLLLSENLAADKVSGEAARKSYVTWIHQEATRLRRLVDDLLDFSRLERGRAPELRVERLNLAAFAVELERDASDIVERAGGSCSFTSGELPSEARLDGEALRRAVLNLVDNAVRHGGEDRRVEIELVAGDGRLEMRVRDFGAGVPRRDREAVFSPFWTGPSSPDGSGTGLGLAITRQIARAHGGGVLVEDPREGPGIVFSLSVPLTASQPADEERKS